MTHRYGTNATMRKIVSKTSFYSSILNDVRGGCIHSIFLMLEKQTKRSNFFGVDLNIHLLFLWLLERRSIGCV